MERDFLGLCSKESVAVVKEEISDDGCEGPGFMKGSGVQWPLTNKVSAPPHRMPFKVAEEDRGRKIAQGNHISTGITSEKRSIREIQVFPASNQALSVSMANPFFMNHFSSNYPNSVSAGNKRHLFGGIPAASSNSGFIAGTTDPWNGSNASGSPAQLTIFYAGTVRVYDDISPEKAQAIMFLAGNGTSTNAKPQIEGGGGSVSMNPPVTSPQSGAGHSSSGELMSSKPIGISALPVSKVDPSKPPNSMRPISAATMITSAIPQAPKASLARFLAKRKERAMNSAPYKTNKRSPECNNLDSTGANFATTSAEVSTRQD